MAREVSEEFDDLCDVVVVFAVFGAGLWIEEVVASDELKDLDGYSLASFRLELAWGKSYHAGHTPDVCASSPFRAQNNFRGSVLSRLNVVREMVIYPAGVSEVGDLHGNPLQTWDDLVAIEVEIYRRVGFVEGDTRYLPGYDVAATPPAKKKHQFLISVFQNETQRRKKSSLLTQFFPGPCMQGHPRPSHYFH